MTSERLFNSFIHPQKLLYPPKQISGYAPALYCFFIAADSIVDAISFIRRIVLWSENKFSPNPAPISGRIVKSGTILVLNKFIPAISIEALKDMPVLNTTVG